MLGRMTPASKSSLIIFFYFILLGERISVWLHIWGLGPLNQGDTMIMFPSRGWKLMRLVKDMMLLVGSLYPLYMTHTCNTMNQYRGFH